MRYGLALECVHTYSLVHDDLPAMDDDDLRRGRPTVHVAFDEATAVLVGDGLQALAFAHLLAGPGPAAGELARLLADNALLMVEGQQRDMEAEHRVLDEAEVLELMRTKTGALLAASIAGGARCAGADAAAVYPVGLGLGLAFQLADDLLDLTADTATLGKRAGKDAAAGKATLPSLLGPGAARARAEALLGEALETLSPLGPRAAALRALARHLIDRKK
jgi:farnesyl diphosphate synthase/geranylgeranyl diphosphate synthase type II